MRERQPRTGQISEKTPLIALAGNPNVGKSSVFNLLTGLHQHTGNWSGKTVSNTLGTLRIRGKDFLAADLPGAYSFDPESFEEEAARNFLAFSEPDLIVYVCSAPTLERNLMLFRSICALEKPTILCVNMTDEAAACGEKIDYIALQKQLGVRVVPISAKKKQGFTALKAAIFESVENPPPPPPTPFYGKNEEALIAAFSERIPKDCKRFPRRVLAAKCLASDAGFVREFSDCEPSILPDPEALLTEAKTFLSESGTEKEAFSEALSASCAAACRDIVRKCVQKGKPQSVRADKILTGRVFSFPAMLFLLLLIFWITIRAANVPSEALTSLFGKGEAFLYKALCTLGLPDGLVSLLICGIYRVVAWIVAVMLPPMAIFFPMFTLLEDSGYLPRIAFNLDRAFCRCGACGKQALTMCMGYGCNAVGVSGCSIIGSERERLIAILTNSFSPCNGRFPMMIALIAMFSGVNGTFYQSLILCGMILFSILAVFAVSKFLSATLLRGKPSSFVLELPPYRMPRVGSVLVHSIKDRTLSVLLRAVTVAAPCGAILWGLSHITVGELTLLTHLSRFLDPFASLFGMDGVILLAFLLGLPANEIVIPIMMMIYLSAGEMRTYESLSELKMLFAANGWTMKTALCTCIFAMLHWPCATTLLTIRRETKSVSKTALSFLLPAVCGLLTCFFVNLFFTFFGIG